MEKSDLIFITTFIVCMSILIFAGLSIANKQEKQIEESMKLQERQVIAIEKISEKGE